MLQQRITAESIPELLYRLESAPYIDDRDLLTYVSYKDPFRSFRRHELVPVAKIISAHHIENWGKVKDHRRTDEYVAAMANAMLTGTLDLHALPPILKEHGGAYAVTSDGITRCALAKLLGMEFIPADVDHILSPFNCHAGTPDKYKTLLDRWQQGLWQGTMTTYHTRSRILFFAVLSVLSATSRTMKGCGSSRKMWNRSNRYIIRLAREENLLSRQLRPSPK